jgi:hypothetical protein
MLQTSFDLTCHAWAVVDESQIDLGTKTIGPILPITDTDVEINLSNDMEMIVT